MKCSVWNIVALGYAVGAFGTFGYLWNHIPEDIRGRGTDYEYHDSTNRQMGSALGGICWPIYWIGTVAIKATAE